MPREDTDPDVRIAVRFQEAYWRDREAGKRRPLAEYLEMFPERQAVVVREYLAAEGAGTATLAEAAAPGEEAPGPEDRIGPYRIVSEIGRGGQGVVYLADDTRLDRRVALKVLAPSSDVRPDAMLRFHREAAVASRLDHPGICAVFDVGRAGGVAYIAMRYVEGKSLALQLAEARESGKRPPVNATVELVARTARALHAAHEAGIVHRDVKPGNVIVGRDGCPVILDFGIARDDSPSAVTLTGTGDLFGTPAYLAPEQLEPAGRGVDRRADVYALGVTLYEALTLERPFEGPTRVALYHEILRGEPADPRRLEPAISRDLAVCVLTAIERDRDRRYRTAAAFADDLEAILAGRPIAARPLGPGARLFRWARREPAKAAVLGLLAVGVPALAALGSYVYATRDAVREVERDRLLREVEAKLERGFFELGEGDPRAARAAFTEALSLAPGSPEAKAGIDLLDHPGAPASRPDAAPGEADAVAAFIAGSRALEEVHRGRLARRQAALECFERAIRHSRHARALYYFEAMHAAIHIEDLKIMARYRDALVQLWPDSMRTRFYMASMLKWEGRREEAVPELERLERDHPDIAVIPISLASALDNLDRHAEAVRAYERALRLSPEALAARRGLGLALIGLGDAPGAVRELRHALRLAPREPNVHADLAYALHQTGDLEGSIAEYREALKAEPDRAWEVRNGLAARLVEAGRSREAVDEYRKALAETPTYLNSLLGLGSVLSKAGENEEALALFEKVLSIRPDHHEALENVSIVQSRLGRMAAAVAAAEKAVRIKPDRARAHYVLGLAREKADDLTGAAEAYTTATRLDPGYAEAWCNLGLRERDLGRFEQALADLRRGHEIGSTRPTWKYASAKWIADVQGLVATAATVDAVLRGETRPARLADWVALAKFCQAERGAAGEAEVLAKAMSDAEPEIAFRLRLQAARTTLRAAGLGSASSRPASLPASASASRPDGPAAARRALAWLGEELTSVEATVAEGERSAADAREYVRRWLSDSDLRLLRDPAGEGLAETDAAGWRALRARVDAFLAGK